MGISEIKNIVIIGAGNMDRHIVLLFIIACHDG